MYLFGKGWMIMVMVMYLFGHAMCGKWSCDDTK